MKRLGIFLCCWMAWSASVWGLTCDDGAPGNDAAAATTALFRAVFDTPPPGPPLLEPDLVWVNDTLASMTLDQKIGQMLVISNHGTGESFITQYHVGGFIFTGNDQSASAIATSTNRLQAFSPRPLWFAIDAEAGLGARVADATIFPLIMALGAAGDPALAEECGRITARECRSVGVHVAYGPVVDVNTEPRNPIISTRSISDHPERVEAMARAFLRGARAEGALCTFKHYPGHGATAGDSHSSLPTVDLPLADLQAYHIKPYRELAATGDVDLVMTAHVWFSQVDTAKPWPATLSKIFLTDILRDEIGYTNIIISDSYGMTGLSIAVPDRAEAAVLGIEAGLDVILMPPSVSDAFNGLRDAALSGRLPIERINASVRRVLIAKSRAGLKDSRFVDPALAGQTLRHPAHREAVRRVCEKAFTRAKNTLTTDTMILPDHKVLVLPLAANSRIFYRMASTYFTNPLSAAVANTTVRSIPLSVSEELESEILGDAPSYDRIVVAGYDWYRIMSSSQVSLINKLCAGDVPVIYVGFGAPYHYTQIPGVDAFYCGYSSVDLMQEVAVEVLMGARPALGTLPVDVEGLPIPSRVSGYIMF